MLCWEPGGASGHAVVLLQRRHPGGHAGLGPRARPGRRHGAGGHAKQVWNQQPPGTAQPETNIHSTPISHIHQNTHTLNTHRTEKTPSVRQTHKKRTKNTHQ